MNAPLTPREVLRQIIDGVTGRRWDDLPGLYAEDTVVEHPFAIPRPTRMEGREALRAHFEAAAHLPLEMRADNVSIHETDDPEVVIGEFDYVGRETAADRAFCIRNIFVLRVRDGQIVESRDYSNHFEFARARGRLPELLALADPAA